MTQTALGKALRDPPSWLLRFVKAAGKGIHRFGMIEEGDRILIGVSGGKDSLALALALSLRRRWVPIQYELTARLVETEGLPLPECERTGLEEFFREIEIPFGLLSGSSPEEISPRKPGCYSCARRRKRLLFEEAERIGANKLALGHHMDDFAVTGLMNLFFRGSFETIEPVRSFFKGKVKIIRPMCEVREKAVSSIARRLQLPVFTLPCPRRDENLRGQMRGLIAEIGKMDTLVVEKVYRALFASMRK